MQRQPNKRIVSTSASRRDQQPLNEEDDLLFGVSQELEISNNRVKQQLKLQISAREGMSRQRLMKAKKILKKKESALDIFDEGKSQLSIASLRMSRRHEEEEVIERRSRLHLLEIEMQKMKKKADFARHKYNILMERRSTNLHMKSLIKTNLTRIDSEQKQYVSTMHNQSLAEKMQRRTSLQGWRESRRREATPVRIMRHTNNVKIHTMNEESMKRNQLRATTEKSRQAGLRMKLKDLEEQKRRIAKQNHFDRVVEQFHKKKEVMRCNDELMTKLNEASNRIKKVGAKAQEDIHRLEECLALGLRQRSNRTERSFFETQKLF